MRRTRAALAAVIVLSGVLGFESSQQDARATHKDTELARMERDAVSDLIESRTDGMTVIWNENHEDPDTFVDYSAVAAARVDDRERFEVVRGPLSDENTVTYLSPDIDGDLAVWIRSESQPSGLPLQSIEGRHLPDGEVFEIVAVAPDVYPSNVWVTGEWVVWRSERYLQDAPTGTTAIYAREIASLVDPSVLATGTLDQSKGTSTLGAPVVDGDWVVWAEDFSDVELLDGFRTLVAARLDGERRELVSDAAEPLAGYGVGNDVVVWEFRGQEIPGQRPIRRNIQVHELAGGTTREITIEHGDYEGGGVSTDGRYVFVSHSTRLAGSTCCDYEVIAYDLQTDATFQVLNDVCCAVRADGGAITWGRGYSYSSYKEIHASYLADRLPSAARPDPGGTSADWTYHPETGHYLAFGFRTFWERSGGLPVFGYPLTEEYSELNADTGLFHTVQYVERQRFEYHPEHAGTAYETQLGRLGAEDAAAQGLTSFPQFRPTPPRTSAFDCEYVLVTRHHLCGGFRFYWHSHGLDFGDPGTSYRESLALFGYPISEEYTDPVSGLTIQYFERAVFEFHPRNDVPHRVLLRRLGAEEIAERGW